MLRLIKSRRMRWPGHVARMLEETSAYKVFTAEGPLGRPYSSPSKCRFHLDFKRTSGITTFLEKLIVPQLLRVLCLLCNPKIHKSPSPDGLVSQMNQVTLFSHICVRSILIFFIYGPLLPQVIRPKLCIHFLVL